MIFLFMTMIFLELMSLANIGVRIWYAMAIKNIYSIFGVEINDMYMQMVTSQPKIDREMGSTLFVTIHKNIKIDKSIAGSM